MARLGFYDGRAWWLVWIRLCVRYCHASPSTPSDPVTSGFVLPKVYFTVIAHICNGKMPPFSSLGVAVRCDILICPFLGALSQDFSTVFDMAQGWLPASATRSLGWSLAQ